MSSECCITFTSIHFATVIFYQKQTDHGMEGVTFPATFMYLHFNCLCLYVYIYHCLHFMYSFFGCFNVLGTVIEHMSAIML